MAILLIIPLFVLVAAAVIATVKARGSTARWFKIFFLALLGLLVLGAGICVLILSSLDLGNMH